MEYIDSIKGAVIVFIIFILAISLGVLYLYNAKIGSEKILLKLSNDCILSKGQLYVMCAIRNGDAVNLENGTLPKCGETIVVKVGLRDFVSFSSLAQ